MFYIRRPCRVDNRGSIAGREKVNIFDEEFAVDENETIKNTVVAKRGLALFVPEVMFFWP